MVVWKCKFRSLASSLSVFGRSILLVVGELLANAILWIVAAVLFRSHATRSNLNMALLAWTFGLRHALDADHISAIDNATRTLISKGQIAITCGLFFSLGHSTIVIAVTIAIAISTDVYNRLTGIGNVGGIIGAAVSGSFLFVVGLANTFILWRILRQRRREKRRLERIQRGEIADDQEPIVPERNSMLMMRILGPIVTFVNRPWKMYPVGVLFGLGFDTASSIALLAVSAIAKQDSDGHRIPSSHVVVLPLLFTAGMSLVDSLDSILMLYSYAGLLEDRHRWQIFRPKIVPEQTGRMDPSSNRPIHGGVTNQKKDEDKTSALEVGDPAACDNRTVRDTRKKMNVMSGLSIVLTSMSILVAFAVSLITVMSLIGEHCSQCAAAAEAEDGGGLAGAWWRGWANAADQSGFVGIGIVGTVLVVLTGWYLTKWIIRYTRKQRLMNQRNSESRVGENTEAR